VFTRRQLLVSTAWLSPLGVVAQSSPAWPNRPIKMVVGFPAGQGSDAAARFYADILQRELGQPMVVENRPGAGATLAAGMVAKAAADGYTLLLTSGGPMAVAPHLYKLPFDPLKELEPVAIVGSSTLMLLVRPDHPARSVAELVAISRQKELLGGSGGNGVTNHLALEMLKISSGARISHVPYKGAAPAMTDLMGGHIDLMFETTSAALTHVRAGRLRALAVASPKRYPELQDVPALSESFPGFEAMTWAMVAAPAGTPASIVQRLSAMLNRSMSDEANKRQLHALGIDATPGTTPASAKAYLATEYQKWGSIIKKANVKLD
jgi:tripartite-type tricarboxylate transporter receptor subunit TctC